MPCNPLSVRGTTPCRFNCRNGNAADRKKITHIEPTKAPRRKMRALSCANSESAVEVGRASRIEACWMTSQFTNVPSWGSRVASLPLLTCIVAESNLPGKVNSGQVSVTAGHADQA